MMQAAFRDYSHSRILCLGVSDFEFAERRQQNAEGAKPYGKQITECKACTK